MEKNKTKIIGNMFPNGFSWMLGKVNLFPSGVIIIVIMVVILLSCVMCDTLLGYIPGGYKTATKVTVSYKHTT